MPPSFGFWSKLCPFEKKNSYDNSILKPTVDLTILTEDRMTSKWGVDRDDD